MMLSLRVRCVPCNSMPEANQPLLHTGPFSNVFRVTVTQSAPASRSIWPPGALNGHSAWLPLNVLYAIVAFLGSGPIAPDPDETNNEFVTLRHTAGYH